MASNDCKIYIYAAKDSFARLSIVTSHQSFVTHVDFSRDGSYLQSVDGARALLFADAATGIEIPSESMGTASKEASLDIDADARNISHPQKSVDETCLVGGDGDGIQVFLENNPSLRPVFSEGRCFRRWPFELHADTLVSSLDKRGSKRSVTPKSNRRSYVPPMKELLPPPFLVSWAK